MPELGDMAFETVSVGVVRITWNVTSEAYSFFTIYVNGEKLPSTSREKSWQNFGITTKTE